MRPWNLSDLTYEHVRDASPFQVAVLPFGATEPHNLHLPYATDTLQVEKVADLACSLAAERGARVVRLPAVPYGTETNQARFPLAMNLNPSTMLAVVSDLIESLVGSGIRKVVLLNGHGGNEFKGILRQLYGKTPAHLFVCHWYKLASDRHAEIFDDPGDHAGELETSMVLAHFPELVHLDRADAGTMAKTRLQAVNRGWVEITRPWHLLTTNSGAGDPRAATAEKGRALTEIVVDRLAGFLVELSAAELSDRFPY
jgi:creatinine amidohydrolase